MFLCCQRDGLAGFVDLGPAKVDGAAVQVYKRCIFLIAPAQNGIDAEQQFLWQEWLCDIIIRPKP
jgi:hypothetical protein